MNRLALLPAAVRTAAASGHRAHAQSELRPVLRPFDETQAVTLPGNVHPLARPEFDAGVADPDTRLDGMMLLLAPLP